MTPQQLHSQVGFYLLPPENSDAKRNKKRYQRTSLSPPLPQWKTRNNLDVIVEASDESQSRSPTPGRRALAAADAAKSGSPKLLRKNTALPGLMFDRPTRHPSLDDLRGYGRRANAAGGRGRSRNNPGGGGAGGGGGSSDGREDVSSGDVYERAAEALKLPPIDSRRGQQQQQQDSRQCQHPQSRICRNLRYNLHQLKIRSQEELFRALLSAIVVGPAEVESVEAEEVLGVKSRDFLRSKFNRNIPETEVKLNSEVRVEPRDFEEEDELGGGRPEEAVVGGAAIEEDEEEYHRFGGFSKNKSTYQFQEGSIPARRYSILMSRPGLRRQFERYARYGEPGASGDFITAAQSEKWLKQAGVIDHWNVTTADTANFFVKISKGSRWLDFDGWRIFLEELAWRKRLNIAYLVDKLEFPGTSSSVVQQANAYNPTNAIGRRLP